MAPKKGANRTERYNRLSLLRFRPGEVHRSCPYSGSDANITTVLRFYNYLLKKV